MEDRAKTDAVELPRLPRRPTDAHKGSVGRVLVIAGSTGLTGAAYLTAKAALRTGAGVVVTACPDVVQPVLAAKHTCVMVRPFPSTKRGSLAPEGEEDLLALAEGFDCVALGPGLGRDAETARLARRLTLRLERRLVLDADGLNAFERRHDRLRGIRAEAVLTPHPGELARLLGVSGRAVQEDREGSARRFVHDLRGVLVLKGKGSLVCEQEREGGERLFENRSGNAAMATAGSGDVLTGVVASLLAGGMPAWDAARLGVYLHGRAGDLAVKARGGDGVPLIASDILEAIPLAVAEHLRAAPGAGEARGSWRFEPLGAPGKGGSTEAGLGSGAGAGLGAREVES